MEEDGLSPQVPLFTFPTVEAPRFPKGYPASGAFVFALWASVMFGHWYMSRHTPSEADTSAVLETTNDNESDIEKVAKGAAN